MNKKYVVIKKSKEKMEDWPGRTATLDTSDLFVAGIFTAAIFRAVALVSGRGGEAVEIILRMHATGLEPAPHPPQLLLTLLQFPDLQGDLGFRRVLTRVKEGRGGSEFAVDGRRQGDWLDVVDDDGWNGPRGGHDDGRRDDGELDRGGRVEFLELCAAAVLGEVDFVLHQRPFLPQRCLAQLLLADFLFDYVHVPVVAAVVFCLVLAVDVLSHVLLCPVLSFQPFHKKKKKKVHCNCSKAWWRTISRQLPKIYAIHRWLMTITTKK